MDKTKGRMISLQKERSLGLKTTPSPADTPPRVNAAPGVKRKDLNDAFDLACEVIIGGVSLCDHFSYPKYKRRCDLVKLPRDMASAFGSGGAIFLGWLCERGGLLLYSRRPYVQGHFERGLLRLGTPLLQTLEGVCRVPEREQLGVP